MLSAATRRGVAGARGARRAGRAARGARRSAEEWEAELDARRRRLALAHEPWLRDLLAQLVASAEEALMARRGFSRDQVLAQASPAVRTANPHIFPLEALAAVTVPVTPAPPARRSKTEERYEQRLRAEGHTPRYEPLRLRIDLPTGVHRYKPDFLIVVDGTPELHEVKGAFPRDRDWMRFEMAVDQWGDLFTFVWACWAHGEWTIRRYPRRVTAGAQPADGDHHDPIEGPRPEAAARRSRNR